MELLDAASPQRHHPRSCIVTSRDTTSSRDPDIRRAWRALCSLEDTRRLPRAAPRSTDAITELLFDHVLQFDSSHFLYLLTNLQIDRLDIAARAYCAEHALFFDPGLLAEETLCVLFQHTLEERRLTPFVNWVRVAMEQAASDATEQPDLARARDLGKSPTEQRLVHAVAPELNRMEPIARRILWLHLVDGADAYRIANDLDRPFEHVEFVLSRALDAARKAQPPARSARVRRRDDSGRRD